MAAYCSRSPYAEIGGAREILQVLSYEPTIMLMTVGFFIATSKFVVDGYSMAGFNVEILFFLDGPIIMYLWPIFLALLVVLIIKFRKSPFDISMSHHAHQEIVRGVTTEMSGPTLGRVEILH